MFRRKTAATLGAVLLKMGIVTEAQLAAASRAQQQTADLRLGEILIHQGILTAEDLASALSVQQRMSDGDKAGAMLEIVERRTSRGLWCSLPTKA